MSHVTRIYKVHLHVKKYLTKSIRSPVGHHCQSLQRQLFLLFLNLPSYFRLLALQSNFISLIFELKKKCHTIKSFNATVNVYSTDVTNQLFCLSLLFCQNRERVRRVKTTITFLFRSSSRLQTENERARKLLIEFLLSVEKHRERSVCSSNRFFSLTKMAKFVSLYDNFGCFVVIVKTC